jgi:hypothetical protein
MTSTFRSNREADPGDEICENMRVHKYQYWKRLCKKFPERFCIDWEKMPGAIQPKLREMRDRIWVTVDVIEPWEV